MDGFNPNHDGLGGIQIQLESFRRSDAQREALLNTLIDRCHEYAQHLDTIKADHDNEKESRVHWQQRARLAESKLEGSPFALALIDGDGAIFQDHLLVQGPNGGSEAAHSLYQEIKTTLQNRNPDIRATPIMVQIYANVEDLSRKLAALGTLKDPSDFNAFASAFSLNQPLFNIIDVGRGKERADHKIREMFRLFANNVHCKQIIFGGCHDNGYLNDLEPHKHDQRIANKLILLETTPSQWQFKNLGFPIVRFNSVFRDTDLPAKPNPPSTYQQYMRQTPVIPSLHDLQPQQLTSQTNANVFNSTARPAPVTTPSSTNVFSATPVADAPPDTPPPSTTSAPPLQAITATSSNSTAPTTSTATNPPTTTTIAPTPSTWATISRSSPTSTNKSISIAPNPKPPSSTTTTSTTPTPTNPTRRSILQNASHERLDPKLPKPDYETSQTVKRRIAAQRLCNNYHLLGSCSSGSGCKYQHGERLNPKERIALLGRTRTTPCVNGSECTVQECFLGHVCPMGRNCTWEGCHFEGLHGGDERVRWRVWEDGSVEEVV